jgi:enediyne polyketide synthase
MAVYLPTSSEQEDLALLLQAARRILKATETTHFILIQHSSFGSGLARTLALEAPQKTVLVVELPEEHPCALDWVQAEAMVASGYTEARYDEHGQRTVPFLQHVSLQTANPKPLVLSADDVLLVTGGGKGIAAECALALACEYGLKLALVGRSHPDKDKELAENLQRMRASIPHCLYFQTDVSQPASLAKAIKQIEEQLGPVTAFLHGAGANTPRLLSALEESDLYHTLAPKVEGLQNVLALLDPERLRLLITFGSIIARTGMRGEADYALANDWLARLTTDFQNQHPDCRCLCLEWSIWSGVGMGERLGRVEALMREGILPITPESGIAILRQLLQTELPAARLVVASRMGNLPTLKMPQPELPFWRFIEQTRVHYTNLELVVDVNLSLSTDLYIDDHQFRGERLLPAVVGLEAIAQNAMALTQSTRPPTFENVRLERPIVIPANGTRKVRIASLVRDDGKVEVVLRSEETGFQVNHFQALCQFAAIESGPTQLPELPTHVVDLDPQADLYGSLLFHQGRYQLVKRYHLLHATECIAEIVPIPDAPYAGFLPTEQVLGDFVMRDAFIHAIQACIPQATILPIAIEQITFQAEHLHQQGARFLYARERARHGDRFIYDLEVRLADGTIQERWQGLHLQQVVQVKQSKPWRHALLLPYLERKASEMLPDTTLRLTLQAANGHGKRESSISALQSMLGSLTSIERRADGKPTVAQPVSVSASHAEDLTLAVTGSETVSCDLEDVAERTPELWQDLLGQERAQLATMLGKQRGESYDLAATRVWTASECLKKAGALIHTPLVLAQSSDEEWVIFQAGAFVIATYATSIEDHQPSLVLAMCTRVPRLAHVHS